MSSEIFEIANKILREDYLNKNDWQKLLALLPSMYQEDLTFKLLVDWHVEVALGTGEAGFLACTNNQKIDPNFMNLFNAINKANYYKPAIEYQFFELLLLHMRVDLRGKQLLEIGGCMPNELLFEDLLIKSYISIEAPDYIDAEPAKEFDHYNSFQGPHSQKNTVFVKAEELSSEIPSESIDHIFSTACFEHIYDLPKALSESHKCLSLIHI